ncbi:MAG: metal ABC transporter permease [Dehalococcoidales bacterium]|nr:metal ABC transporter permease [Dehalococcoidales bacterium]
MIEILQYEFMQNAFWAGLLAAIACGIIGTYVIVKRMVFISGGIAHASFGGIGIGYFMGINPIIGALVFTIASALGMGALVRRTKLAEDTAIGIFWSIGMALGIIFIALTPGYAPDLFSYLFGNILTVPASDLLLMIALDGVIILVVSLLYKEFAALSFDEEFGRVVGLPVERLYLTLLCLIALTVVLLIRIVGIILIIALLTIPAAMARRFTSNLRKMMMLAVGLGIGFTFGGLWLSYAVDLPSGATIILVGGGVFLITLGFLKLKNRKREAKPV